MKSPGPTRLAPASSRYRYAPRKTTTNTSAVCVCIPASNPGRNFVNPPNGPLAVSPQTTELETPGTSGEYLTVRERAKMTELCSWSANTSAVVNAITTATAASVHARSEEHTSELQSRLHLVCRLLL